MKSALPNLAVVEAQFLLRSGQILFQSATLGGYVDRARGVQFDDDDPALQPDLQRRRRLNSGPGSVNQASEVTAPT